MPRITPLFNNLWLKEADDALYPTPPGESLTRDEVALIKSIFGDSIKTEDVKKYFSPKAKKQGEFLTQAQTFGKDSIKFYGQKQKSADYSRIADVDNCGLFVHEMTHIWQNQNNKQRSDSGSYRYKLKKRSHFKYFSKEEQASIMQDYAIQFLCLRKSLISDTDQYLPVHARDQKEHSVRSLSLLAKVVEEQFPEARKTRLALEAKIVRSPAKAGVQFI
jgi:hypothetical protein